MKDKDKTKEQLISELDELRNQISKLEVTETECIETGIPSLSLEEYQRLFEQSPLGITILDNKGVIKACNPIVYSKSGYSKDDYVGKHFSKLSTIQARDIPGFIKVFASLIRGKVPEPFEVKYRQRDGSSGWTEVHINILKVNRKINGVVVIQHDITERKQAEEEAHLANERLQYLLSASPAIIYTAKPSGDYGATFISENVSQIVGYEAQEFTKDSSFWIDRVHRDDLQKVYDTVPRLFENPHSAYEYRFKHRNGDYIWIRDEMKLIRDEKGNPIEIVGYWADITERKKAEEALQVSEARSRALLEAIPDMMFHLSKDGTYIDFKPSQELEPYVSPTSFLGKKVSEIMQPEVAVQTMGCIEQALRSGNVEIVELRLPMGDEMRDYESRIVRIGKGEVLGITRDITKRKLVEGELRESEERYRGLYESSRDGIASAASL